MEVLQHFTNNNAKHFFLVQQNFFYDYILDLVKCSFEHLITINYVPHRGKWGKVNQIFPSVSQGVYIANMVIFMY